MFIIMMSLVAANETNLFIIMMSLVAANETNLFIIMMSLVAVKETHFRMDFIVDNKRVISSFCS